MINDEISLSKALIKTAGKEILLLFVISLATLILIFLLFTFIFSNPLPGNFNSEFQYYFSDIFNHTDFIYSYPAVFAPYILFSIYRFIKHWLRRYTKSPGKSKIISVTSVLLISILVIKGYQVFWNKTSDLFFRNRNHYYTQMKNVHIDNTNYKKFAWEGGYNGPVDALVHGIFTFPNDSIVVWSYNQYDGMKWDFPLRYYLKRSVSAYSGVDTFQVIEDTVIIYHKFPEIVIDVFKVKNNHLLVDLSSGHIYNDFLKYFQMHDTSDCND